MQWLSGSVGKCEISASFALDIGVAIAVDPLLVAGGDIIDSLIIAANAEDIRFVVLDRILGSGVGSDAYLVEKRSNRLDSRFKPRLLIVRMNYCSAKGCWGPNLRLC